MNHKPRCARLSGTGYIKLLKTLEQEACETSEWRRWTGSCALTTSGLLNLPALLPEKCHCHKRDRVRGTCAEEACVTVGSTQWDLPSSSFQWKLAKDEWKERVAQLCLILCDPMEEPTRLLCPWDSPGKNTGVGCHTLLQGIFPTQGLNSVILC